MSEKYLNDSGLSYFWTKIKAWCNSVFALDSHVVHTSGDEDIDGKKTFIGTETRITNSDPKLIWKNTSITRGVTPSSTVRNFALQGFDSNGRLSWAIEHEVTNNIANCLWFLHYKHSTLLSDLDNVTGFRIGYNSLDIAYMQAYANLTITSDYACVTVQSRLKTRNVAPSEDHYDWFNLNTDSDNNSLCGLQHIYKTNKDSYLRLMAAKGTTTTNTNADFAALFLGWESDVAFASCPSTPDRAYDTDIVTRDWIPKDTRIVHTTGNESIAGTKTFTNSPYITKDWPVLILKDTSITRNVAPSSAHTDNWIYYYDSADNPMGRIRMDYNANKSTYLCLHVYSGHTTNNIYETMGVGFDENGIAFGIAPSTSTSRTGVTDIVTRDWIPKDTRIVHTSGDETVNGTKTFSANLRVVRDYPEVYMQIGEKRSVTPSASRYYSFVNVYDNAAAPKRFFLLRGAYYNDKATSMYLGLLKGTTTTDTSSDAANIGVGFKAGGTSFGFCPTPASSSNTNEIATTAWVRTYHSSASDERLKQQIDFVPDEILDAWENISFYQFKFNESVEEKGNSARLHNGVVAQRIDKVFKDKNLDVSKYGLFVLEKWDEEPDTLDENGNVICKGREAGEQYSIRYTEMLCMEAAYQRRENARLKKRVADLEERLAALELKVS